MRNRLSSKPNVNLADIRMFVGWAAGESRDFFDRNGLHLKLATFVDQTEASNGKMPSSRLSLDSRDGLQSGGTGIPPSPRPAR